MRNLLPAFACSLGLLISGTALADGVQLSTQPSTTPATFSTGPESNGTDRIICKHVTHQGMLLSQVACGTQHQWDYARFIEQQSVSDLQTRSLMQH